METNRIEYKQKLTEQLEKEVVAFLNYTGGGIIYLGIDNNGNTVGLSDVDELQLQTQRSALFNCYRSENGNTRTIY